jgi:hypothetical protein
VAADWGAWRVQGGVALASEPAVVGGQPGVFGAETFDLGAQVVGHLPALVYHLLVRLDGGGGALAAGGLDGGEHGAERSGASPAEAAQGEQQVTRHI